MPQLCGTPPLGDAGMASCAGSSSALAVLLALSVLVSPLKALIAASLRLMVGWFPSCRTSQLGHTKYGVWSRFPRFSFACGCLWSVRACLCCSSPPPFFYLLFALAPGCSWPLPPFCCFGRLLLLWWPYWVCFPPFRCFFVFFVKKYDLTSQEIPVPNKRKNKDEFWNAG